ncbi:MAG TPA: class I SAM-dependent methyltransferase, partial [Candidatus Acidoferrum sp.]|nr:class I SAM-dependent methyltransferase [Candidatus Acidoferrum sp.]
TRGGDDLEGWAQLCPDCLGKAGDNPFLRFRLHEALRERSATGVGAATGVGGAAGVGASTGALERRGPGVEPVRSVATDNEMVEYYEARAWEYDEWYLRRGRYARGPIHDAAWQAELEAASDWLQGVPLHGRIVELAAGTGWWSPILAGKGELWAFDGAEAPLERARDRLLAHRLRAHLHVRDAWAEPDAPADGLFTGFWLSHVPRARLAEFLGLARRWLSVGGTYAFIDSRYDPQSSALDHRPSPDEETTVRRLNDGRTFTIPKVFYEPPELERALREAGFLTVDLETTDRFFLLGTAIA